MATFEEIDRQYRAAVQKVAEMEDEHNALVGAEPLDGLKKEALGAAITEAKVERDVLKAAWEEARETRRSGGEGGSTTRQ